MKTTLRVVLALALFTSFSFAGDQGTGGYHPCDPTVETCPPPPPLDCTENCINSAAIAPVGGEENSTSLSDIAESLELAAMSTISIL